MALRIQCDRAGDSGSLGAGPGGGRGRGEPELPVAFHTNSPMKTSATVASRHMLAVTRRRRRPSAWLAESESKAAWSSLAPGGLVNSWPPIRSDSCS